MYARGGSSKMVHLNIIRGGRFPEFRFFDFYVRVAHLAKNGGGPSNEINRVGVTDNNRKS